MSFPKRKQTGTLYPWSQRKLSISNPFPRYGHSASQNAINNELFLFGGIARGKPRNEVFTVEVNTLNVLAFVTSGEVPSPRSGHTQVNIGTNIIVFGGLTNESMTDENLYILDIASKVWSISVFEDPPLSRHGHSATIIGGKMYIFGGQHDGKYLNDLISFDIKSRKWDVIIPRDQFPPGRSGHISYAYKEKIYIFGGIDENQCYNDTWCYDTWANSWAELLCTGYFPLPRHDHGSTMVNDIIYVFGGKTYDKKEQGDLAVSDQRWFMFQKMGPAPSSRSRHTMTAAGDKILVLGGESMNSPKPDEEGIIHIKYPSVSQQAIPQQIQQGSQQKKQLSPQAKQLSPKELSPNLIDNNGSMRLKHIFPTSRQSSNQKSRNEDEKSHSSKSGSTDDTLSTQQFQQAQISSRSISPFGSPRMAPENTGGGMYSSIPPGYPRGPASYSRQGSPSPRGMSAYDVNTIAMSNSKGNPPEQIIYMERSTSPQSRSQYGNAESLRKKTSSPFGNAIDEISKQQQNNDNLQQQRGKKQFENPRQAPRPPNPNMNTLDNQSKSVPYSGMSSDKGNFTGGLLMSPTAPSSPASQNSNTMPPSPMSYEEVNSLSSTITNSPVEVSDTVDHSPARIERDDLTRELQQRDQIISTFKRREMWFRTELTLARKSGYTPGNDTDNPPPDGIDIEHLLDMKELMLVANQAQISSQKITESERARTAALQEAAYFKAKLTAIMNSSESKLASIEVKRANDLEKRLTQALTEKENIHNKYMQSQQKLNYETAIRESAEEQTKIATFRAEEAEEAHARALSNLATLHSRATTAEALLRETKTKLIETSADLTQNRSGNDSILSQLNKLQQSVEQHQRALEKANDALTVANERTSEFEKLWKQSRQEIQILEKETSSLRAELDVKMQDLDRLKARAIEMESLLDKAHKESETMRATIQEGMNNLLDNSSKSNSDLSNYLNVTDKLQLVEQELSELKIIHAETQRFANDASTDLSDAKVKILQLESSVMKARSESAQLQRRLGESNDEIMKIKVRLREKERTLDEKVRALEDSEVKAGMMRDVMTERGILFGNLTGGQQASTSLQFREMEARYRELENMYTKAQAENAKFKDVLQKIYDAERSSNGDSKNLTSNIISNLALEEKLRVTDKELNETQQQFDVTRQKLNQLETDYKTATHYVKGTEKMLRRMKDELTKNKSESSKLKLQLSTAQHQNEDLEDKISELENQMSLQKGFRASRQEFANIKQIVIQREEFLKEKEEMEKKISELSKQVEHAMEEKCMSDQSYEALKKEYDHIRKEYNLLRQTGESLKEQFSRTDREIKELKDELEETLSLNELLNQQLDEALKNNGHVNEKRFSVINREHLAIEQQKWKAQKEYLELQIKEIQETNDQLQNENIELGNKLQDSENKISLLLDQVETAVVIKENPRDSRIINALTNELDVLKSQYKISDK
ncbi:18308_t:CDS:10 [Funneliformis geosporum]|uniref:8881_t:CDS:1 n=1 Tax=Funneliformis geosporum TaxID=1117311 RepID=A0A9W4SFS2_9GLOM|nr:18308_t:CDS:10 [Funneliformis geosporum]CAI2167309.1 8881_t:CDS:10 [Funneliformis geosporum]